MKKTLLAVALFISITSFSQNWSIGDKIYIGHGWTNGNMSDNEVYRFHPSFQIGRNFIFNANQNFGMSFGLQFSTEGLSFTNKAKTYDGSIRSNFLRMPIQVIYTFGNEKVRIRPRVALGPSIGWLVGGKTMVMQADTIFSGRITKLALKSKIDVGAVASFGLSIKVADGIHFIPELNYYQSLIKTKYEPNFPVNSFTYSNVGLSLTSVVNLHALRKMKGKMYKKNSSSKCCE